jgi:hypothetical protein
MNNKFQFKDLEVGDKFIDNHGSHFIKIDEKWAEWNAVCLEANHDFHTVGGVFVFSKVVEVHKISYGTVHQMEN